MKNIVESEIKCQSCVSSHLKILALERECEKLNKELSEARGTDPMTGLVSKKKMYQDIEHLLAVRRRNNFKKDTGETKMELSVIFIDIDEFKKVNDLDHLIGDSLIVEFADLLRTSVRETDIVARFGGDEFCITACMDSVGATDFVEKLQGVFLAYRSMHLAGYQFKASIGFASTSEGEISESMLLVGTADKRLAQEKLNKKLNRL